MPEELFSEPFINCVDNVIRNSEAHFNYEMDPVTQMITFKDKNKTKKLYLVDFAKDTLNIFYSATVLWELSYQLYKKYRIICLGERPAFGHKMAEGRKYKWN